MNKSFQPPVTQHLKNHLISQKLAPLCNRRLLVNLEKKLPSYWTTVGNLPGYHLKEGSAGYWDCGCFSLNARTASAVRHFSVVLLWQTGIKESERTSPALSQQERDSHFLVPFFQLLFGKDHQASPYREWLQKAGLLSIDLPCAVYAWQQINHGEYISKYIMTRVFCSSTFGADWFKWHRYVDF